MDHFQYKNSRLYAEEVDLAAVVKSVGTPCYVYSRATLEHHYRVFQQAFGSHPHTICYAVKANSNIALLNVLAQMGSGFDIVSSGELERVVCAQGATDKVVFSGVAKQPHEIARALHLGIMAFNVESLAELARINDVAGQLGKIASIALRVNPDVDANTHPYISTGLKDNKFGIAFDDALEAYLYAKTLKHLKITGIACHIGSQLTQLSPFVDALQRILVLIEKLKTVGIDIHHLDIGGGLGIPYKDEQPPSPADYAQALLRALGQHRYPLVIEPGRAIVGNAGILLTTVEHIKHSPTKHFAVVDAGMNDLLRPALYSAWMDIIPLQLSHANESQTYDVVGPVCETADFLGKDRRLSIEAGSILAVRSAGAYGFCMSSNYNSRPRAAEVMVDGDRFYVIRQRESFADLIRGEQLLPK